MADRTYTQAEVTALLAKASGGTDLDAIAARPYQTIKASDGTILFHAGEGSPIAINGQHPDDYYGVNDKGVATQNVGDEVKKPKGGPTGALPDDFPAKAALADAGLTTYAKVRAYGDLTELPGIGAATEAKIQDRLAADAANGGS